MKIRPKTFECVLELIKQGYSLYVDDQELRVTGSDDYEVSWGDAYGWRNENSDIWQSFDDWHFKK